MRRSRLPSVARQLLAEIPDADLLERYVLQGADDAFAQLVTRYSRLVWGQCRNLLPDDADADDAFQATFLTLARSAKSIRTGAPLGPWLHGVAYRVCQNARRAMGRRAKREKACAVPEADRPIADSTWEAAFAAVSEEVQKLPESQRTAFVLCCIEGRATTEAAASLGQKLGTFSARLTRAKQTLLDRLAKRGLGATVLALGGVTGSVSVAPAALVERTLTLIPPGVIVPSSVNALMHGVTGMMMLRFKLLAAGVMVATGLGLSVGAGMFSEATAQGPGGASGLPAPKADPPKGDGIEKLKADLEKAKAELAKAEAEVDNAEVKEARLRLTRVLREKVAAPKYEYEPLLDKGLTTQAFEAKLAEREKVGWEFLGQVSFDTSKVPGAAGQLNNGTTPCFVFRKQSARTVILNDGPDRESKPIPPPAPKVPPAPRVPTVRNPTPPPADVSPAIAPKPPIVLVPSSTLPAPTPKGVFIAPEEGIPPSNYPGGEASRRKEDTDRNFGVVRQLQELGYQARIAELEKQVAALKAGKAPTKVEAPNLGYCKYEKSAFGQWDVQELIEVLVKLLADDIKAGKFTAYFDSAPGVDSFTIHGATLDEIRTVTAWLKKLKK